MIVEWNRNLLYGNPTLGARTEPGVVARMPCRVSQPRRPRSGGVRSSRLRYALLKAALRARERQSPDRRIIVMAAPAIG